MDKHAFLRIAAILMGGFVLGSCIYEYEDSDGCMTEETVSPFTEGYSINVKLTLDNMGGPDTRATSSDLRKFENYIDPEKCRVLFFDNQDRFLFESKSRWVKQLNATTGGEQWLVSVPMYAYGNDVEEKWRWQQIRRVMMTEEDANGVSFKVAILANRPLLEVYPDLETENSGESGMDRVATNFSNSGPHWTVADTRFGGTLDSEGNNPKCKKIIDLHHTQEDPIYRDKGDPTKNSGGVKYYWTKSTGYEHFYDFVMGHENGYRLMSSTSSWVDYGTSNSDDSPRTKKDNKETERRAARKADTSYPIPMYGVQNFGKIEKWIEGVPFNLSDFTGATDENHEYNYQNISLLRSVVKLELMIPKKTNSGDDAKPKFLALMYSNVYARCEPMDVWTPTNKLWEEGHGHADHGSKIEDCEWFTVQKYARMVKSKADEDFVKITSGGNFNSGVYGTGNGNTNDLSNLTQYHRRLGWFYGAWLEKGWNFQKRPDEGYNAKDDDTMQEDIVDIVDKRRKAGAEPPRIFNPCIQRNQYVLLDDDNLYDFGDNYYHYVVYTGERTSIDPNYLYYLDNTETIRATVCYWYVAIGDTLYGLPLMKYENNSALAEVIKRTSTYEACPYSEIPKVENIAWAGNPNPYPGVLVGLDNDNPDLWPWALMRNHHYTITIGGISKALGDEDVFDFDIRSDVNYSETLELK